MSKVTREYRVTRADGSCEQWTATHNIDCNGVIGDALSWLSPTGASQSAAPAAPPGGVFEAGECCDCTPNPCRELKAMTTGTPSSLLGTDLIPVVTALGECATRSFQAAVMGVRWVGPTDDDPSTPLSLQLTVDGADSGPPIPATFLEDLGVIAAQGLQGVGSLSDPIRPDFDVLPVESWCPTSPDPSGAYVVVSTVAHPDGARVLLSELLTSCSALI